jgi:HK97 family phage major capsid protein
MDLAFGTFLRAVRDASSQNPGISRNADHVLREVHKAAMGETGGMVGGYLVPRALSLDLMKTVAESSIIYSLCTKVDMTTLEHELPMVNAVLPPATGAAGVPSFFGGMTFSWGFEETPAETEPSFTSLMLKAWDLIGYSLISNQLLSDMGPEGETSLVKVFGKACAWFAEYAFFNGTGAGTRMPLGILKAPCAISQTRAAPTDIAAADISAMASKMLPFGWSNAVWACSPTCIDKIAKLSLFVVNQGPVVTDQPSPAGYLLTRPLYVTDKLPPLGTAGDLVFFDPSLYVVGNRQEVVVEASAHSLFRTNQTVFRMWLRMDGKPYLSKSVTLQDNTTVVSSIVYLG